MLLFGEAPATSTSLSLTLDAKTHAEPHAKTLQIEQLEFGQHKLTLSTAHVAASQERSLRANLRNARFSEVTQLKLTMVEMPTTQHPEQSHQLGNE